MGEGRRGVPSGAFSLQLVELAGPWPWEGFCKILQREVGGVPIMKNRQCKHSLSKHLIRLLAFEGADDASGWIERNLEKASGDTFLVERVSALAEVEDRFKKERYDAALLAPGLDVPEAGKLISDLRALNEETAIILLVEREGWNEKGSSLDMAVDFLSSKEGLSHFGQVRAIRYAIRNREQQLRLRNFSRLVAHDLLGPVGNVRNAAETFSMVMPECEGDAKELLEVLRSDCDGLIETLSGLHEFSASQNQALNLELVSLEHVLEMALDDLSLATAREDGRVVCGQLPEAKVDPELFSNVFRKLIQNGLTYNQSDSPCVRIDGVSVEGFCELRFVDNGIGIDPAKSSEVFRPLHRLQGAADYKGVGLGLSVCKEVVERHNGNVWLDGNGDEGRGSTFCVRFVAF